MHEEEDFELTPREASRDYAPYSNVGASGSQCWYYAGPPPAVETGVSETMHLSTADQGDVVTTPSSWSDTAAVRGFLNDAGVIPRSKPTMTLTEMLGYLHGSITR